MKEKVCTLSDIRRLYVRKKENFRQGEESLTAQLKEILGERIHETAIYHRYDVDHLSGDDYEKAVATVFSEPPVDSVQEELPKGDMVIAVEFLPGQYDQRADSAEQCLAIVTGRDGARVRCALVYVFHGDFTDGDREKILKFLVNPVESREASLEEAETLDLPVEEPKPVAVVEGVRELDDDGIDRLIKDMGLAMSHDDLAMIREYFRTEEKRDPTVTEIRVLDTYWSDHCRHTTFSTELTEVGIEDGIFTKPIKEAWNEYADARLQMYGEKTGRPVTLMDMATVAVKALRKEGRLENLDSSEEINACTIKVTIEKKTGSFSLRMKRITILRKSNLSAVRRPVSAAASETRCPDVLMYTRRCVSPALRIRTHRFPKHLRANYRRRKSLWKRRKGIALTEIRLALPQGK